MLEGYAQFILMEFIVPVLGGLGLLAFIGSVFYLIFRKG